MKIRYRVICLICLCLCSVSLLSQVKTSNRLLQDIVAQLPDLRLDEGAAGDFNVPSISSRPIVIDRDRQGTIVHVGIKLFNRDIMAKNSSPLYHFVERYLLELLLLSDHEQIATRLKMERVQISSEMFRMNSYKEGIKQVISSFSPDCSIHIIYGNNRYSISCITKKRVLLKMTFPGRHELITGFTKLEAESSFYLSLLSHRIKNIPAPTMADVSFYKENRYMYNEDTYMVDNFVSTSYYKAEKGKLVPLFSKNELPESIYNLFNALHNWGVNVEITQNMYGSKKQTYTLPLYRLVHYLLSQNCVLYSGIKKMEGEWIEGTALAVNVELGYQHLLSYKVNKSVFDRPKTTVIDLKVYSFIPIDNVSSVFFENDMNFK